MKIVRKQLRKLMKLKMHQQRLRRKSKTSNTLRIQNQREEDSLSPQELWEKYRPLQGFLDSISPESKAQILASSRESLFERLRGRSELTGLELRGDTLHPLGLVLD